MDLSDIISLGSSSLDELDNPFTKPHRNDSHDIENGHISNPNMTCDNIVNSNQDTCSTSNNVPSSQTCSDAILPIQNDVCVTCPIQNNALIPAAPTIMVDILQNPIENTNVNVCDIEQLRLYIEKECYEGSTLSHPVMFKDSLDR